MIGKNERISHNHIFASGGIEYHDFGDIICSQGFTALVDCVGLGLITAKPYEREFLLMSKPACGNT